MRAVVEIEETKKGRHQIVVTEMPYGVNKATLIERIAELVTTKKDKYPENVRDESARGVTGWLLSLKRCLSQKSSQPAL